MQRDPDLHRRSEFGWWLGGLAFGVAVGAALPIDWWAKLLIALELAVVFLPVFRWITGPVGRVLRLLLTRVPPRPEARWTGSRMTVCEKGANSADPNTSRVLIEFAPGMSTRTTCCRRSGPAPGLPRDREDGQPERAECAGDEGLGRGAALAPPVRDEDRAGVAPGRSGRLTRRSVSTGHPTAVVADDGALTE